MTTGPDRLDLAATALFLDVDGTLIDIAPTPDAVSVPPALPPLLAGLRDRLSGALALVSGRPIAELDRLFAPLRLPAAGIHGAEIRLEGSVEDRAEGFRDGAGLRAALAALAEANPGVEIEDKGAAIAIHYRAAPAAEAAVRDAAAALSRTHGLHPQHGKCVVELKASGRTKGDALREMMACPPFAGRVPVMIGDDVTDEDGFRAALTLGGRAIRVGTDGRETAATQQLDHPGSLAAWLGAQLDAAARTGGGAA